MTNKAWANRLVSLYDDAKKRNEGKSLAIYQEVSTLLDYLEGVSPIPTTLNLPEACDNLAAKLRRS